jgi:hypothetical protein
MQLYKNGADHTPSPCRSYLNYGLFEYPERVQIWDLRLDTWYYQIDEELGHMGLQDGPVTCEGGPLYLWQQLAGFRDAFADLARLRPVAQVNYQEREPIPAGYWAAAPMESEDAFVRTVETGFRAHDHILQGAYVMWEGRAMVRDHSGDLVERWLPDMGFTRLYAGLNGKPLRDLTHGQPVQWRAPVYMNFVSLFRRDNTEILTAARDQWKRLQALEPPATVDFDESSPAELIVALADPPAGTPPDNEELYERNTPRLREAIRRWEQATGHPFEWEVSLED